MIGQRIRDRRTELGLSLRDLAKEVDLTASFLSQIERDLADPSIKSLRRIADALSVPMLYFLAERGEPDPVVRRNLRKKLVLPHSKVAYELLTPDLDRKMEMFVVEVYPSQKNIAHPLPHPTEECILVLSGCLHVKLNDTEYVLESGDSIYFEGGCLCNLSAANGEPATFVSAVTPAVF
jgi:transcriptional regulator with XRE-family HTH domain